MSIELSKSAIICKSVPLRHIHLTMSAYADNGSIHTTCQDITPSGTHDDCKQLGVVTFTSSDNVTISDYGNADAEINEEIKVDADMSGRSPRSPVCVANAENCTVNCSNEVQNNALVDGDISDFTASRSEVGENLTANDQSSASKGCSSADHKSCVQGDCHKKWLENSVNFQTSVVKSEAQQHPHPSSRRFTITEILNKSHFDRYIECALAIQHENLIRCLAQQISSQAILQLHNTSTEQLSEGNSASSVSYPTDWTDIIQGSVHPIIIAPSSVKLQTLRISDVKWLRQPKVCLQKLRCSKVSDVLRQPIVCLGSRLEEILKDEISAMSPNQPNIICVQYDDHVKRLCRPITDVSSTTRKMLDATYRGDTRKKQHKCLQCGKMYLTHKTLYGHVRLKHTSDFKFQCTTCLKKFLNKHHYCTHVRHHLKILRFQCDICKRKFVRKPLLIHHLLAEHDKRYQCPHCTNEYSTSKALRTHLRGLDNRYQCPKCSKILSSFNTLKRHVETIH